MIGNIAFPLGCVIVAFLIVWGISKLSWDE